MLPSFMNCVEQVFSETGLPLNLILGKRRQEEGQDRNRSQYSLLSTASTIRACGLCITSTRLHISRSAL